MAQRRMFSKSITNSSEFLMMPPTSQLLYIHLGMNADDDGFCEHFSIMRMTDSKPDDLKILQIKSFVKVFDERVLVIKNWKENNYIPKDRYQPSKYLKIYKQELKALTGGKPCIQNVYKMDTQDRLGKDRLGKDNNTNVRKINFNENDKKLTELLYTLVLNNYPFLKDKWNKENDYEEMNKLNRIDGYTYKQIEYVIQWSQQDNFWKQNIRSVNKLREKFEELVVRIKGQIDNKNSVLEEE